MTTYCVPIIESERGWGQRTEGREYFQGKDALVKAMQFADDYNKEERERNNIQYGENHSAPDVYWFADSPYLVPDEEAPKKKRVRKSKA